MAAAEITKVLDVSLKSYYETLIDFNSYAQFVAGVKSTKVLETKAEGVKVVSFDMEIIKPISYTIEAREFIDESKGIATLMWTLKNSDFLNLNNGGWQLKQLGPKQIEVQYRLDLEFKISVPGFILKNLVKSTLPKAVDDFYQRAKKKEA